MLRTCLLILVCLLLVHAADAVLDSPQHVSVPDSVRATYRRGIELAQLHEVSGLRRRLALPAYLTVITNWKTEWQAPGGTVDRIRQDGKWYTGLDRRVSRPFQFWGALSGEHYDDQPLRAGGLMSRSSVHILRGGGGSVIRPWKPLAIDVGAGGVQDRRLKRVEGGLGLWTRADIDDWDLYGYQQDLTLQYNRETPRHHENSDLIARYDLFREFYPGNTNRLEASASVLSRDVYLTAASQVSRRVEKEYVVRDELAFDVRENVRMEMAGDLVSQGTTQEQSGGGQSSLKENQAGLASTVIAGDADQFASLSLSLRSVNQTIRGEILQGHKGDLSFRGRTPLPFHSLFSLRMGVSKYSLDTPNPLNFDDRDELQYSLEGSWSKSLFRTLVYELHGVTRLDHLVYLFRQSSANNRWTRFFLAGTTVRHRPNDWFTQTVRASVSANYQDYDFEMDPRETRSTVFRRFTVGDTLNFRISSDLALNMSGSYQIEEFGRLFWASFEEERSDETRSSNAAVEFAYNISPRWQTGIGALWDRRRGERFPDAVNTSSTLFQNLESYGPTFSLGYSGVKGFFLSVHTQVIRQFQLRREDRWLTLGEAAGGIRW